MFTIKCNNPLIIFKSNNVNSKPLDLQYLTDMNIQNFRISGASVASGATLCSKSYKEFQDIKSCGIDAIVDYRADATTDLKEKCAAVGINYFSFPLDGVDTLNNETYFGMTDNNKRYVKNAFINKLNEYFKIMNAKNVYTGCQYGIDRTNVGLTLNYLLNSNVVHGAPQILTWPGENKKSVINKLTKMTKKILNAMTSDQKNTLGLSVQNNDFTNHQAIKLVRKYKSSICY